jgi:polyhydroxyalkanoate synthesis regulator phasin
MSKQDDDSVEARESIAKKIWLAGLGAYGQRFDDAVEQYNKVNEKTSQLFTELVNKGTAFEELTRNKIEEVKSHSTESIDQRVSAVRQKLGLGESEEERRLSQLEAQVAALTKQVEGLLKKPKATRKTTPKPKSPKK